MPVVGRLDQYASMLATEFDDYSMSENLALNSEAINNWPNNGNAISISVNSQIAPDGTLTADVLSQTVVTGASRWVSSMTRTYTAGVTYTLSIWLKKISGTDPQPTITLWVNFVTSQSVGTITTEWVRYSKSFTPASTISVNTFTGTDIGWDSNGAANNFTFAAWGFQLEIGSVATDYTPTTTTAISRVLPATTNTNITGLGTYYSSGFYENVGVTTFLSANVFAPYDPVYDDFGGTSFGAGQGRYMRQNTDRSAIVYNEIDEVTDFYGRGIIVRDGLVLDLDASNYDSISNMNNLFRYSQQFDNAVWTSNFGENAPVTANQIAAPDGTITADLITFTPDGTGQSRKEQNIGSEYGTYTVSIFVKNGTIGQISLYLTTSYFPYENVSYNFNTDTITNNGATGTRTLYPNGWVRLTATATVSGPIIYSGLIGFSNGTLYVWGAQLEPGLEASSYDVTTERTWIDLSPYGNNGTLVGGLTYSSANGGSIVFDGSNDYVSTSYAPTFNDFTVIAWFKSTSNVGYSRIVDKDYINGMWLGRNGSNANSWGGGVLEASGPYGRFITLQDGNWHMIASIRQGTTHTIYGDGITNSVSGTVSSSALSATAFKIGVDVGNVAFIQGSIPQVSVYNRALTAAEILQNYNALKYRFGL
jgi:hypothetical protein